MAPTLSKPRVALMLLALFLSSMCTESDIVITPVVSNLYETFSDSPTWLINYGITGPAFTGLPFCVLGGWLADRYDKKILMVAFFALFTVSSTLGAVVENAWYFVIMRQFAAGVAWAVTNAAVFAIFADIFTDKRTHSMVVGWYWAASAVVAASMALASGMFAVDGGWTGAYRVFLASIPILIMLILFVPSCPPQTSAGEETAAVINDTGWWKRLVPLAIQGFFVCLCYFVLVYMPSVYVMDSGIGNEAMTGLMASLVSIFTAIGSALFGIAYIRMKKAVYLPAIFILGLGFIVMMLFPVRSVALVSAAVMGFVFPFYFSYLFVRCTELVTPDRAGRATGIVLVADGLASALSSYAVTETMAITGATNCLQIWPWFGVVLFVVGAISIVWYFRRGRRLGVGPDPEVAELMRYTMHCERDEGSA